MTLRNTVSAILLMAFLAASPLVTGDDEIFAITELATKGRVVTADFADFNGDGQDDLLIATLDGVPPGDTRNLSVYLRQSDGAFPGTPSHDIPIPQWSAVYDIADIVDAPGEELVLLRPDRVTILSLASDEATQWHLPIAGPTTVAAGDDERGFDRLRLVYDEFDDEPWILVPQIGQVSAVATDGSVKATLDVGRRANYYVTRSSGLLSVETDIQLYYDAPKLSVGDVDGDGRADLVASTRHEIRVFLQRPGGGFPSAPNDVLPIGLISREDHARGGGGLVTTARDLDNDGRLDLMISYSTGSFTNAVTTSYVYQNRDGSWNLAEPDERFESEGGYSSDLLLDVDGDDELELIRVQVRFSILEIVEFLLTREIDVQISVHRLADDGGYDMKPWSKSKLSTEISFETFRPKGFMPTGGIDLNADGLMDFVTSADGKGIEVYLGSKDDVFSRPDALQELPSAGVIRFVDFDEDELTDFVLWDPQTFDSMVRVGRNNGSLSPKNGD